jgi:hypothetical protein
VPIHCKLPKDHEGRCPEPSDGMYP